MKQTIQSVGEEGSLLHSGAGGTAIEMVWGAVGKTGGNVVGLTLLLVK